MELKISKKQLDLKTDITKNNLPELSVLGSTQSGKTFIISLGMLEYARELYKYDPDTNYYGAIIGWTVETIKDNIVENIQLFLDGLGLKPKNRNGKGDYTLKIGGIEKWLKIYNVKFFFCSFNNIASYNKILGKPLIFLWIDESAKIYSDVKLRETYNQLPTRQVSFVTHPFLKRIESFNVEGGENHSYKIDYLDNNCRSKKYTFFPWDNPKLDSPEAMQAILDKFPEGSLRQQKIYNKWTIAEGKVFTTINVINNLDNYVIREIGIGVDYGSTNATTFVAHAIALEKTTRQWHIIKIDSYYHESAIIGDSPTTEYYSQQLRYFLLYLKKKYMMVPVYNLVVDSEAKHFINRLEADNIPHTGATKGAGSVEKGVQYLQSLMYKKYYQIQKLESIRHFNTIDNFETCNKDEILLEFEGYQYDKINSMKSGQNCYKKEKDHGIDASRYILQEWLELKKTPMV